MRDCETTLSELRTAIAVFVAERQWEKFHRPKNLASSIVIEAAELLEHFQWEDVRPGQDIRSEAERMHAIGEEMADVLAYLLSMANALEIDLAATLEAKMKRNAEKYPVEACLEGRHSKYQ